MTKASSADASTATMLKDTDSMRLLLCSKVTAAMPGRGAAPAQEGTRRSRT
jgi:hypothetical protein